MTLVIELPNECDIMFKEKRNDGTYVEDLSQHDVLRELCGFPREVLVFWA